MCRSCRNTQKEQPIGRVRVAGVRTTLHTSEGDCLSREKAMNEQDESIWADGSSRKLLICTQTHVDCTVQYVYGDGYSMSDDANRLGLRLAEEPWETSCSQRTRNRIRRSIVWQAAYGPWHTHLDRLVPSPQSSKHSGHLIVSSSPMTPYTH